MMKLVKRILIIIFVCVLILVGLITYNNNKIELRQEEIISNKLDNLENYHVIYFSDLHFTNFINKDYLEKVINRINEEEPDLVIFGGDLIDKLQDNPINDKEKNDLIDALSSIKAKNGKYAILGNHDYNNGSYEIVENIYFKSDFKLLKDSCIEVAIDDSNSINLLGIDSLFFSWDLFLDSYKDINPNNYTFAIIHHPDLIDYLLDYPFDYVLTAHSHGGQIYIPLFEKLYHRIYGCNKYFRGIYNFDNYTIDVSNGVGRTKLNARFNADSEIVKYTLKSAK